jgi:hypothetical protein
MSTYAPSSSVGWLDLDAAASERVAALLRALEAPGTLDPLGLGSIRDVFSGVLSPGTSTIQTRLRYFVFLPWIFQSLERDRVTPADFPNRLRDREAQLIDCLRPLGPNNGVIGYNSGRELKRLPREIYWGGLISWRLSLFDLSLAEYAKRAAAFGRHRPDRDDDGNITGSSVWMWAPLPAPPEDFLHAEVDFKLRLSEAELLIDHIRRSHPDSLIAELCKAPTLAADARFPWDLPTATFPQALKDALHHARCFSELTVGPQHVYNVLLARKARIEFGWDTIELESSELNRLDAWTEIVRARHADLSHWVDSLADFWVFVAGFGTVSDQTHEFVQLMVQRVVEKPLGFVDDATIQSAIRSRELRLNVESHRIVTSASVHYPAPPRSRSPKPVEIGARERAPAPEGPDRLFPSSP